MHVRWSFAMIGLLAISAAAHAQSAELRNAATWYQRAIDQGIRRWSTEEADAFQAYLDNPSQPPSPLVRSLVAEANRAFGEVHRASMQEYCDFALDRDKGFELTLPHLNSLRGVAKLMQADAFIKLHDGDASSAADRLADLYRMSGHFGDDRIIISSLVGQAVLQMTDRTAQIAFDRADFNAADSAKLLAAVKQLSANDPFRYLEAIAGEQELVIAPLEKFAGDFEARAKFLASFQDNPAEAELTALDEESFLDAIHQYDLMMDQMIGIFELEDPEAAKAELARWEEAAGQGAFGPVAKMMSQAFTKVFERKLEGEKLIADRIAMLEKLAAGEVQPEETANAAVWYLRGIEWLEQLEATKLESVRAGVADLAAPMAEPLAAMLVEAQPVIDIFRDGSMKRRCDFRFVHQPQPWMIAPSYAPGMHDALKLVRVDAIRLMRAGDLTGAIDRFTIAFGVIGHMGGEGDPHIASALIAHRHFNDLLAFIESALTDQSLGADAKPELANAIERISRIDPFGYLASIQATRKNLGDHLGGQYTRSQEEHDRRVEAMDYAKSLNGDQLLYFTVILDTLSRAGGAAAAPTEGPAAAAPDPLARLKDVISHDAMEAVRNEVPLLAPSLARHEWDIVAGREIPTILVDDSVTDHLRRARGDLRRAVQLLMPDQPAATTDATHEAK